MTLFIVWATALVTAVTAYAMLQDVVAAPLRNTPAAWAKHIGKLFGLVMIAAASGLTLVRPDVSALTAWDVVMRIALACFMVGQTPAPWFYYVTHGKHPQDRRRPA